MKILTVILYFILVGAAANTVLAQPYGNSFYGSGCYSAACNASQVILQTTDEENHNNEPDEINNTNATIGLSPPATANEFLKKPLFNLSLQIPPEYMIIEPGREIVINLHIFNLGDIISTTVRIDYKIADSAGKIIISEEEYKEVKTEINLVKEFKLSEGLSEGTYTIDAEISYNVNLKASAKTYFSVKEQPFAPIALDLGIYTLIFLIILTVIMIIIVKHRNRLSHEK